MENGQDYGEVDFRVGKKIRDQHEDSCPEVIKIFAGHRIVTQDPFTFRCKTDSTTVRLLGRLLIRCYQRLCLLVPDGYISRIYWTGDRRWTMRSTMKMPRKDKLTEDYKPGGRLPNQG